MSASIAVSIGRDYNQASVERHEFSDFEALAEYIRERQPEGGFTGPYLCAPMVNGHRNADCAQPTSLVVPDFDSLPPDAPRKLCEAITEAGWRAALWTTRKSTPESPRVRVVFELDRPVTKPEYAKVYRAVVRHLGEATGLPLVGDPNCEKPEQPAVLPQPHSTLWMRTEGTPLNVDAYLAYDPGEGGQHAGHGQGDHQDQGQRTGKVGKGKRNQFLSDLAYKWRRHGLDVDEIAASLHVANGRRCDPPLADDEVRQIAAGKRKVEPDQDDGQTYIRFRPIHEIIATPTQVNWLLRGILEQHVIVLVAGKRGTFKSFLALHWAMTLALRGVSVFIVSAEGAGLARRVEAWLRVHAPKADPVSLPLYVHEQRVNFSDPLALSKVRAAVEASGMAPELLIVDTFSKNSGALDENSNSDVKAFIGGLDVGLRTPLNLSIILVAHTGHGDQSRVRGASALEADTDAALIVNRIGTESVVTVDRNRFKDAPEMPALVYRADVIDLGRLDDDGQSVTSLVMREADDETRATVTRKAPTGRAQRDILRALRNQQAESNSPCIWTLEDMRKVGRDLGQHRNTARDAVDGLICNGFLTATVGGHRLTDANR